MNLTLVENQNWTRAELARQLGAEPVAAESPPLRPFKQGAIMGRFRLYRRFPSLTFKEIDMNVQAQFRLNIRFKKGPPTYGENAIDALERLLNETRFLISQFEPEFD